MATEGTVVGVALTQIESQRLGYHGISLTNFDTDAEPDIAAGSKVEIGGALYNFSGTTSISNFSAIATAASPYIYLTPAGTAVTASYAATAPSWSDSKQGWYSGDDRAIGFLTKASTAGYANKAVYSPGGRGAGPIDAGGVRLKLKVIEIGDWNMDADATVDVTHSIPPGSIRFVHGMIRSDSDMAGGPFSYRVPHFTSTTGVEEVGFSPIDHSPGTAITLRRLSGGIFDSTSFNATSYNRGWITIGYAI